MSASLFLVLLLIYAIVAVKVEEWTTIFLLGFRIETPQGFLARPGIYIFLRRALFVSAILAAITTSAFPWYVGFLALVAIACIAILIGRKLAYNNFRRVHRFLAEDETDPKELAAIEAGARLTDKELKARLVLAKKYST